MADENRKTQTFGSSKTQSINKEKLTRLLPKGVNHKVTDEIINSITMMERDTGLFQDYMEESVLSHLPILKNIKCDLNDYVNAIKYCNLKKGMTNEKAWEIIFPDKFARLKAENRQISSHVAMYNSNKIVVKIDAEMMVDIRITYAPALHEAFQKEVSIMRNPDVSFHVQHLAAKTLIEVLSPLEEQKHEIKIGQTDEAKEATTRMTDQMRIVAENQQKLILAGHSIQEVQKLNLTIEVEGDDDNDEDEFIDLEEEI